MTNTLHISFCTLSILLTTLTFFCETVFQFVGLEALTTAISDMYPAFFHVGHRRKLLLLAICVVCFFLGLSMVTEVRTNCNIRALFSPFVFASADHTHGISRTQGGLYIFQLFDYYACSGMTLLLFAILQSVCVTWIYGQLVDKRKNLGCFLLMLNSSFYIFIYFQVQTGFMKT